MRLLHLAPATLFLAALGGCVAREPAAYADAPAPESIQIRPQQRSYLDAGPAPARPAGPSYSRDGGATFAGRSDSFGNGVLPSF